MDTLILAKQVLQAEADAIKCLEKSLDSSVGVEFNKVIAAILTLKGRVVLTGMGKSGHIAKKIAATLASTGTPAFYIHPAEASHGDLGMLTTDDLIIALSKSGSTAELEAILQYSARYGLPVVAITSNEKSILADFSKYILLLPQVAEACPLGAAPTTSTTLMLALGDALALALLHGRGFTAENFNTYHPGGHLGKKLMLVQDIMHTGENIPLVPKSMLMSEALILMSKYGFGCLGIVENNQLEGIITDGDLRRNMNKDFLNNTTAQIMMKNPIIIQKNTPAAAALQIMNAKKITSLFIVENHTPVGIIHIHDCLRAGID